MGRIAAYFTLDSFNIMVPERRRNLPLNWAIGLYVTAAVAGTIAYALIRGGACPIPLSTYYVANTSLAITALGIVAASITIITTRGALAWLTLGVGPLILGVLYVVLGAVGSGCSGI